MLIHRYTVSGTTRHALELLRTGSDRTRRYWFVGDRTILSQSMSPDRDFSLTIDTIQALPWESRIGSELDGSYKHHWNPSSRGETTPVNGTFAEYTRGMSARNQREHAF